MKIIIIALFVGGFCAGWQCCGWFNSWQAKKKAKIKLVPQGARSIAADPEQMFAALIFINGREAVCRLAEVSYSRIVELAGKVDFLKKASGELILDVRGEKQFITLYTVTYGWQRSNSGGHLSPGQTVKVASADGAKMIFCVMDTSHA